MPILSGSFWAKDDRGQPVRVPWLWLKTHGLSRDEARSVTVYRNTQMKLKLARSVRWRLIVLVAAALYTGLAVRRWNHPMSAGDPLTQVVYAVWWWLLLGFWGPLWRLGVRRDQRRLRRLPSVCGPCGYSLTGLAPDPDGCTVCPECGAAWRLPGNPNNSPGTTTPPHATA